VITILILLEDGDESVVDFLRLLVLFNLLGEANEELGESKESESPPAGHNSGAGVSLTHTLEEADVEGVHTGSAQLFHVLIKPQVVGSVRSQIWLITIQVSVPHFIYII
jgi:hypothetical protein